MRIRKKFSAMALTLLLAVSSVCAIPVYAQDYNCNGATLTASWDAKSKKLSLNESGVLFEEENIVPGDRINSQVVVKNDTGTDVTVALIRVENANNTEPDLYKYMTTSITQGHQTLYAGNMVNGTTGPVTKEISSQKGRPRLSISPLRCRTRLVTRRRAVRWRQTGSGRFICKTNPSPIPAITATISSRNRRSRRRSLS